MKKTALFAFALLLAGSCDGFTAVLHAKETATPNRKAGRVTPAELRAMDTFLDSHSVIDDQLRQHPGLASDAQYLKDHPEFAEFVAGHPGVECELAVRLARRLARSGGVGGLQAQPGAARQAKAGAGGDAGGVVWRRLAFKTGKSNAEPVFKFLERSYLDRNRVIHFHSIIFCELCVSDKYRNSCFNFCD